MEATDEQRLDLLYLVVLVRVLPDQFLLYVVHDGLSHVQCEALELAVAGRVPAVAVVL